MTLTSREKTFIYIGGFFILVFLAVPGARYVKKKLARLDQDLQSLEGEKDKIILYGTDYTNIQKPPANTDDIILYLENLVSQLSLADIARLTPRETAIGKNYSKKSVKISFKREIDSRAVLSLIDKIESEKGTIFRIEKLVTKKHSRKKGMNIVSSIEVASFIKKN